MCKSKAQGGQRCAYHIEQGASTALVSLVSVVDGTKTKYAREEFDARKEQGVNMPAPTRGEVDAFLADQVEQVEKADFLTPPRKRSILNRLREAIGKVKPDGATFHAWRTIMRDAWSKARRKATAGFLAGVMTFSVGACGQPADSSNYEKPESPGISAPVTPGAPSATAAPDTIDPYEGGFQFPDGRPVSKDADSVFGAEKVDAGYEFVKEYNQKWGNNPDFISYDEPLSKSDIEIMLKDANATPGYAEDIQNSISKMNQGNEKAKVDVFISSGIYNETGLEFQNPDEPFSGYKATNPSISTATKDDGTEALKVSFRERVVWKVKNEGVNEDWTIVKDKDVYLVQNRKGDWQLDAVLGYVDTATQTPSK